MQSFCTTWAGIEECQVLNVLLFSHRCGAAHMGFSDGGCGVELFASCRHLDCFPRGIVNDWIKKIANGMVWESLCFLALALVWLPLSHW